MLRFKGQAFRVDCFFHGKSLLMLSCLSFCNCMCIKRKLREKQCNYFAIFAAVSVVVLFCVDANTNGNNCFFVLLLKNYAVTASPVLSSAGASLVLSPLIATPCASLVLAAESALLFLSSAIATTGASAVMWQLCYSLVWAEGSLIKRTPQGGI